MKKILLFILLFLPLITFGEGTEYTLLEPIPCIQGTGQTCTEGGLIKKIETNYYIQYIYKLSFAFAAVAAVVVIMYAGFEYATTDIIGTKAAAKSRIENAIVGLLTLLASYLILQTIDPRLTDVNTKLDPIKIDGQVFDYNALVNTATDYKINQSLNEARQQMDPLRAEAKLLRQQADEYNTQAQKASSMEETIDLQKKAGEAAEKAVKLEKQANTIGAKTAVDANYELAKQKIDTVTLINVGSKETKELYSKSLIDFESAANKTVAKLVADGNTEGANDVKKSIVLYKEFMATDYDFKKEFSSVNAKIVDFKGSSKNDNPVYFDQQVRTPGDKLIQTLEIKKTSTTLTGEQKSSYVKYIDELVTKVKDSMTAVEPKPKI